MPETCFFNITLYPGIKNSDAGESSELLILKWMHSEFPIN